jgi:hypothetical protein
VFGSVSNATQNVDEEEKKDKGRATHIGSLSRGSSPAPALVQICKVGRKGQ